MPSSADLWPMSYLRDRPPGHFPPLSAAIVDVGARSAARMSSPSHSSLPESFVDENGVEWYSRLAHAIHVFVEARAKLVGSQGTENPSLVAEFTQAANAVISAAESAGDDEVQRVDEELRQMQAEDQAALRVTRSNGHRWEGLQARLDQIESVRTHLRQRNALTQSMWSDSTQSPVMSRRGSHYQPGHSQVRLISYSHPYSRADAQYLQHSERNLGLSTPGHCRAFSPFLPVARRMCDRNGHKSQWL